MKTLVRAYHTYDRSISEYDDGSIDVAYHITDGDHRIIGFTNKSYPSRADYEIDKLDQATAKIIPVANAPETVAAMGCHHNFRHYYGKLEICIDCQEFRSK